MLLKSIGQMKIDTMNGPRKYKKVLNHTGPINHKKILCLEKDTDKSFVANEIRLDTEFSKENTKRSFVNHTLGYYAWMRQKKEGKTILPYEEWYELYEPYKRIKDHTNE